MKPLLIILKTLLIGCLWSIIFIDGIRVVLLVNWHFDIFLKEHWALLSYKWNSGASMTRSEMGFLLIIVSTIPLWLTGWVGLCMVKWGKLLKRIFYAPLYLYKKLTLKTKPPVVVKKKSINEETNKPVVKPIIKKAAVKRPPLPSATLLQSNINNTLTSSLRAASSPYKAGRKNQDIPEDHALFNFDDDDFDLDFDFEKKENNSMEKDIPSALVVDTPKSSSDTIEADVYMPKSKPENQTNRNEHQQAAHKNKVNTDTPQIPAGIKESHTPVLDVLNQKGYDVIPSAIIKNTKIDYVAVSKDQLILCLIDKEVGDWLADEEKFNDEEPLWFSESSHRISPVRKIDVAADILKTKLALTDMKFEIVSYVIIQSGNIINAEDMFEIWGNMNINVTRINRGSPKEIRLFSKTIDICDEKVDKSSFEKLKKLIRSLA